MFKMEIPKPGEKYTHFKGEDKIYQIVCFALDCENPDKKVVVYKSLYDSPEFPFGTIWVRDLENFVGDKVLEDGSKVKRFKKI